MKQTMQKIMSKIMYGIAAYFTMFAMAVLLTACGGKETKGDTMEDSEDTQEEAQDEDTSDTPDDMMMDDADSDDDADTAAGVGSNIQAHVSYACTKSGEDPAIYTYFQYKKDSTPCDKDPSKNCLCQIKANTDGEQTVIYYTTVGRRSDCESEYLNKVKNGGLIVNHDVPNYEEEGWECSQQIMKLAVSHTGPKSVFN